MYYSPEVEATSFLSGRGVYLISEELTIERIINKFPRNDAQELRNALHKLQAEFCSLPAEHLGEKAVATTLSVYLDDLRQTPVTWTGVFPPTSVPYPAAGICYAPHRCQ